MKPREGRYCTVMPLLTCWQRAESKCHAQTSNRIAPAVPCVQASETTQIDGIGIDKRTCTLAGSGVPTARAAALLDVVGATPASHAQRVRLGRALTKAARALGHLDGSGGTGVSTPRRGRRNTGIGGGGGRTTAASTTTTRGVFAATPATRDTVGGTLGDHEDRERNCCFSEIMTETIVRHGHTVESCSRAELNCNILNA